MIWQQGLLTYLVGSPFFWGSGPTPGAGTNFCWWFAMIPVPCTDDNRSWWKDLFSALDRISARL